MRIRTNKDNRQLSPDEIQFESVQGAISTEVLRVPKIASEDRWDTIPVLQICTVRGIPSRQAQFAMLDAEALDAFIAHLQEQRLKLS